MEMTSTIPVGEDPISIYVYDPVSKLEHIFRCSKTLLASKVGYFANQTEYDRLTIENCDLCLFDWMIRWVHGETPTFATTNVLRVLLLASFLSAGRLVQQCLDFCLEQKVDMSPVPDADLERLSPHASARHLEGLEGIGRLLGRLFYTLTAAWTDTVDPRRGNFCCLARLYRCEACGTIVHADKPSPESGDGCRHRPDASWDVNAHVARLHKETRSWQRAYWRLWGEVHYFLCPRCRVYFPAELMTLGPAHHPSRIGATYFACCDGRVRPPDFLNNVEGGVVPDEVVRALYDTLGVYLSRVRETGQGGGAVDPGSPREPIVDMSVITRAERIVPESSYPDPWDASSASEQASCKDQSDDQEDASLGRQNVDRWFCDDGDKDAKEPTCNAGLLGPHGDSPACPGKQSVTSDKEVCTLGETHPTPNKQSGLVTTEDEEAASEEMPETATQDGTCEAEESGSDEGEWVAKTTHDDECNAEESGSEDGEWVPKMTRDDERNAEDSGSEGSNGSEWMPNTTDYDRHNAEGSGSDGSKVWIPTTTEEENCDEEEIGSDDGEWSEIPTREDAYGAEEDCSSASSKKHAASDESASSCESRGESEEQGMGEESDGATRTTRAAQRRKYRHYHHWHSHLSRAHNQMNQHDLECHENQQIVHYLTSKIYNLRKAEVASSDYDRSRWLTHIVPREGAYVQIEKEMFGVRTRGNKRSRCLEEIDISTSFLYGPPSDSDLLEQNE